MVERKNKKKHNIQYIKHGRIINGFLCIYHVCVYVCVCGYTLYYILSKKMNLYAYLYFYLMLFPIHEWPKNTIFYGVVGESCVYTFSDLF